MMSGASSTPYSCLILNGLGHAWYRCLPSLPAIARALTLKYYHLFWFFCWRLQGVQVSMPRQRPPQTGPSTPRRNPYPFYSPVMKKKRICHLLQYRLLSLQFELHVQSIYVLCVSCCFCGREKYANLAVSSWGSACRSGRTGSPPRAPRSYVFLVGISFSR